MPSSPGCWKALAVDEILAILRQRHAPRVWTTRMLERALDRPPASVVRAIRRAVESQILIGVRGGIYLNGLAHPVVAAAEAAGFVRTGAVVSLQTVLGDAAVLNNPTPDVTCLLSTDAPSTSSGAVRSLGGPVFSFRRLAPGVLFAGDLADRFEQGLAYLRATPEKALLDWIALGVSPHSTMTPPPPHDMDVDLLDRPRLLRLAHAMGLNTPLAEFLEDARRARDPLDDPYAMAGMGMGL